MISKAVKNNLMVLGEYKIENVIIEEKGKIFDESFEIKICKTES